MWVVRSKFEDELAGFMLEKKFHTKGIGEMLDQHLKEIHEQFSHILTTIKKNKILEMEAPTFAITTRSEASTRDPPFPNSLQPTATDHTGGTIEKGGSESEEPSVFQNEEIPQSSTLYHVSKSSKAMIHMPNGAKVLKDLLSHKEKLEKAASSVKISEECSAVIQRSLPQKEGDPRSFMLPCLIGPLAVKNTLGDLGASINLMPHSLFQRLGISNLKPTRMSIQLADRSIKYPIRVSRAVIDVHEGKLSLRVGNETITFKIGKSMKSKYSRDDYLYCADHTTKLNQEQWVNTVDHDGKWIEIEEGRDSDKVRVVSFYPRAEPVELLEWKAPENRLKPSSVKPPKLELKELPEHLKYAFLQEDNQLPVVISSALSATEKTRLLEVLRNHKEAIA
ncbi:putative reverse transcriptase domain-containing protein [Tanacetum coccineum]